MYTLGINAVFHDPAACLIKDGRLIAAADEARFTLSRQDKLPVPFSTYKLPFHAIDYCLRAANIHLKDIDHIAYSFNPELLISGETKHDPFTTIPYYPQQRRYHRALSWNNPRKNLLFSFILNAPAHLTGGYPDHLQKRFRGCTAGDWEWHFVDHHLSHAASAYLPSPFTDAAIMTLDGRGELASTTYNIGEGEVISRVGQVEMPHSLGLLCERVAGFLGFLHAADEGRVMALAAYGKPVYQRDFREMITIGNKGKYTVGNEYFEQRFGRPRKMNEPFNSRHFNIARSLQLVLEETVLQLADWLQASTKKQNLCFAGSVALNSVLNAKLRDYSPFEDIWVQPAAGHSGTALGAALWIDQAKRAGREKDAAMKSVLTLLLTP